MDDSLRSRNRRSNQLSKRETATSVGSLDAQSYRRSTSVGTPSEDRGVMTRRVRIGEAKSHQPALLAGVEAGEDLIICRGTESIARITRIHDGAECDDLRAVLRGERAKQSSVTTAEVLAWRHERHSH